MNNRGRPGRIRNILLNQDNYTANLLPGHYHIRIPVVIDQRSDREPTGTIQLYTSLTPVYE